MLTSAILLVHLVSFAAYLGAGFAQLQFMKRSAVSGVAPALRDAYESLSATILTKIELPAIMGSLFSGVAFLATNPTLLKLGWVHGKMTCIAILLVLSHLEMFNARAIVKARISGDSKADEAIAARKKRHGVFGTLGTLVVVALLVLVTFVRLG